jgi:hypothetical protein
MILKHLPAGENRSGTSPISQRFRPDKACATAEEGKVTKILESPQVYAAALDTRPDSS